MRFAIFGKPFSDTHSELTYAIFDILKSYDDYILADQDYFHFLEEQQSGRVISCDELIQDDSFQADVVISIGGDGTFLRTAARVGRKKIPMIGVNTGRLGFLADITEDMARQVIGLIHSGLYTLEKRSLLELRMNGIPDDVPHFALNDIAILKHDISSMINIHTGINGQQLTTYMADGLVIATPTGSTAYSLSVGGPIITPGTDVIELTPVASHSLTMRPLIIQNNRTITINVESRSHSFLVSVDGHSFSCADDTPLEIRRAPFHTNVIKPQGSDFFQTLREKMMWGADTRSY